MRKQPAEFMPYESDWALQHPEHASTLRKRQLQLRMSRRVQSLFSLPFTIRSTDNYLDGYNSSLPALNAVGPVPCT
jgi:hypothetical protein